MEIHNHKMHIRQGKTKFPILVNHGDQKENNVQGWSPFVKCPYTPFQRERNRKKEEGRVLSMIDGDHTIETFQS